MHSSMQTSGLLALAAVGTVVALPGVVDVGMEMDMEINRNNTWAHRAQHYDGPWYAHEYLLSSPPLH
jgi:hypothetical protein